MSIYVLIHGAWHGEWCWDKVSPFLVEKGHKVITLNLPGHSSDSSKRCNDDISLEAYVESVCNVLDEQPEPVILVGHSMGGIVISQAAEYRPEKIQMLIYLAAFLPDNGQSLYQLIEGDPESKLWSNLIFTSDQKFATVRDEAIKEIFYQDCTNEDVARAKSLLVPQAFAAAVAPVQTSKEKFGRVRRIYITTLLDNAVTPTLQQKMYSAMPCEKVLSMNTSHSPFFSAAEELANKLIKLK